MRKATEDVQDEASHVAQEGNPTIGRADDEDDSLDE